MTKDIECFRCGKKLGEVENGMIIAKYSISRGRKVECRAVGEMGFTCSAKYCNFSGWYVTNEGWVQSHTLQYNG